MTETLSGPAVAVVIPCYNAEATIGRTIRSLRNQRHVRIEIIVVDDGSTDGSLAAVREAGPDIRLLTGPNAGACAARNRGLHETGTPHVLFLDADDELEGDHLANGIAVAEREGADLVLSPMVMRTEARVIEVRDGAARDLSARTLFRNWLIGAQVNPSAMLWRRDFLMQIGGWGEGVLIQQDGELAMRAFTKGAAVAHNPRGYGIYYIQNEASLAASKSKVKEANYVETLAHLLELARGTACEGQTAGIEFALYRTARQAFLKGWTDIGRRALTVLATIGPVRHHGTWRHRLLSQVLGLERKSRLWRA